MDKKVSIIIPAYNVENYIFRAIESCIKQTYRNIEIIIVDDGSSDNTLKIIDKYEKIDNRIKKISKKNEGVSSTRNKGLEISTGDYIIFLDSDDWLESNTVEYLINMAKKNKDYLIAVDCYFAYFNQDMSIYKEEAFKKPLAKELYGKEALIATIDADFKMRSACYKIFDNNVIKENKLSFDESISHGEDGLFVFMYLQCVKGFKYETKPLWNILERPGSATTSKYTHNRMTALDAVEKMKENNCIEEVNRALDMYLVSRMLTVLHSALETNRTEEIESDIKSIRIELKKKKNDYLKQTKNFKNKIYFLAMTYVPTNILSWYFKMKQGGKK